MVDKGATERPVFIAVIMVVLIVTYLIVGVLKVNEANDPGFEDTSPYLQIALFVKDHGGAIRFLTLCLDGEYKADGQYPLYPLLLSSLASREPAFFERARITSMLTGLVILIVFFLITRDLYGTTTACLAAVLLQLNETFLRVASHVQGETLLILFVVLSLYWMVKGTADARYWGWAGIAGGFAYLAKGTGLLLVPLFVTVVLFHSGMKVFKIRHFWMFFVGFLIVSSPLLVRNVVVYGNLTHQGMIYDTMWLDNFLDLYDTKYGFAMQYPELVWKVTNAPTLHSYWNTHTVREILDRANAGIYGEFRLLIDSMKTVLPIPGSGVFLFVFFCAGLMWEIRHIRALCALGLMIIILFPAAWQNPVSGPVRYLSPLLPVLCMYSAMGMILIFEILGRKTLGRHGMVAVRTYFPAMIVIFMILIAGYVMTTKDVRFPESPASFSEDQTELSTWIAQNLERDDLVLLNYLNPYGTYAWALGLKGTVATGWRPKGKTFDIDDIAVLNRIFTNNLGERAWYVIVHRDDIADLPWVGKYFANDNHDGLIQTRPLKGWTLAYAHSGKPTVFMIYKVQPHLSGSSLASFY